MPGILVIPQPDKLDMSYVVRIRPFEEFEIRYKLGLHPDALSHLRSSESLTPSAALRFRKVRERALFNNERLQTCIRKQAPVWRVLPVWCDRVTGHRPLTRGRVVGGARG
jgi:hypothetical protein